MIARSLLALVLLTLPSLAAAAPASLEQRARVILRKHCVRCHGGARTFGGLNLTSPSELRDVLEPGKPEESRIIELIEGRRMPLGGPPVPAADLAVLKQWIRAGAKMK